MWFLGLWVVKIEGLINKASECLLLVYFLCFFSLKYRIDQSIDVVKSEWLELLWVKSFREILEDTLVCIQNFVFWLVGKSVDMNCQAHESFFLRFRSERNYMVWHNIVELELHPHICVILEVLCWIKKLLFSFLMHHCVISDHRVCRLKIFHLHAELLDYFLQHLSSPHEVSRFLI